MPESPLLFVDIDGVLNPYGDHRSDGYTDHWLFPKDVEPVRVCACHATWLHALSHDFELVWGTSWSEDDRALLATVLDLPPFSGAVQLPAPPFDPVLKVPAIDRVADGRPLAWLDDLLMPEAWSWASSRRAPTLLVPVDPATGLTERHVAGLLAWAREICG
jgi:hypothetical protein